MTSAQSSSSRTFVNSIKSQPGTPLLGTILTIPSPTIAQLVGANPEGDFVMIDMEHAPMTIDIVTQMVHSFTTASGGRRFALVRIPSHGVEWVKWALDSGAAGIIVPMVNNASEMRAIADRALYPPKGRRSYGPFAAPFAAPEGPAGGVGEYFDRAKRGDVALLPMIESKEGLENVEEILSVDGVSGTLIGPVDLRLSLGLPIATDGTEEAFVNAMRKVIDTAKRLGRVAGTLGIGEEAVRKRTADGADFLLSSFDTAAMANGLKSDFAAARKGLQG